MIAALLFLLQTSLPVAELHPAGTAQIARILGGDEVVLADGRELRLAGVLAPRPQGPDDAVGEGLDRTSRALLAELAGAGPVLLLLADERTDRHGRLLAHLLGAGEVWVNAELVRRGAVRVFTTAETAAGAQALYAMEDAARAEGAGLWALPRHTVEPAAAVRSPAGRFAIVHGRIRDAARVGGTLYLNFGDDWRTDFTIQLDSAARRRFPPDLREAAWWRGRAVETRGLLENFNGPLIRATHPAQIRLLGGE